MTFAATMYGTFKVSALSSEIGIGVIHDPLTWFVFLGGTFASLMLAGIGQTLGMLCAIYDRQVTTSGRFDITALGPTDPSQELRQPARKDPTVWEKIAESDVDEPVARPPIASSSRPSSGLWKWLTRERHFTSRDNDK